jgi:predicted P-loop ATPase
MTRQETKRDRGGRRPRSGDATWMEDVQFVRDSKRRIMSKRQNVYLMLKHDPMLADLIAFDEIAQRVIVRRPVPFDDESIAETGFPKRLDGVQRSRLLRYLEKNPSLPKFSENDVKGGIEDFADRARFNSLADHLNGLKWDGVMRMHRLFEHYFGATNDGPVTADRNSLYLVKLSTWFLTGLARRALQPGCVNQYVVVLSGHQGLGKSSGLKALCGDQWFTDRMPNLKLRDNDPKRFFDMLRGRWIVEIAEAKSIKGADPDGLKEFITQATDEFKPAYEADQVVMPRSFVFVVTRNPEEGQGFLRDTTGNRRFWPIDCGTVLADEIEKDRDQLIAEAVDYVRFAAKHECGSLPFYPDEDFEAEYLRPLQAELVETNEWDDIVAEFLENYTPGRVKPITIIREVLGKTTAMPKELAEIGKALCRTRKWRRAKAVNAGYERIGVSESIESDLPF